MASEQGHSGTWPQAASDVGASSPSALAPELHGRWLADVSRLVGRRRRRRSVGAATAAFVRRDGTLDMDAFAAEVSVHLEVGFAIAGMDEVDVVAERDDGPAGADHARDGAGRFLAARRDGTLVAPVHAYCRDDGSVFLAVDVGQGVRVSKGLDVDAPDALSAAVATAVAPFLARPRAH